MSRYGARFIDWLSQLRSSFGFIPAIMACASVLLAFALLAVPESVGTAVADFLYLPPVASAEAQRDLMSLIAGSTIGTGAVAFSVIVAASVTAASQYGPRLLTNFLADRATQSTLGVFVASFCYSVVIYAAIRDDAPRGFAGLVGMTFAFGSVAALVYFLHHAPAALRINQMIAQIGATLLRNVETRFPANCGLACADRAVADARRAYEGRGDGAPLFAGKAGFLSIVDGEKIAALASAAGVFVVARSRPGAFVTTNQIIAEVHGGFDDEELPEQLIAQFAIADVRTPAQDNEFLADELVEISLRALSPGINDPVTANACLAWLGAALGRMAGAEPPTPFRCGEDGSFRLYAEPLVFSTYLSHSFGRIRQHAAGNLHAVDGFLRGLAVIAVEGQNSEFALQAIHDEAQALRQAAERALSGADAEAMQGLHGRFLTAIAARPPALDKFMPGGE